MVAYATSKDGLNFGVDGDVRGWDSVDHEFFAGGFREPEKTADVIVLVVTGEKAPSLCVRQSKDGKRHRLAKIAGVRVVQVHKLAQRHGGSAARSFSAHAILLSRVYAREREKRKGRRGCAAWGKTARRWTACGRMGGPICRVFQGLVRYLARLESYWRKEYEHRGGTDSAGFYAVEPGKKGSKGFGFRREKERRTCVVPAGLEPDMHQ